MIRSPCASRAPSRSCFANALRILFSYPSGRRRGEREATNDIDDDPNVSRLSSFRANEDDEAPKSRLRVSFDDKNAKANASSRGVRTPKKKKSTAKPLESCGLELLLRASEVRCMRSATSKLHRVPVICLLRLDARASCPCLHVRHASTLC